MQKITLYKYARADGGTTVSPNKPEGDYTILYRLIADEGKVLTDGEITTSCIDTDDVTKWREVDAPEEPEEPEIPEGHISDTEALKIITGETV
jgi:hypothetical protein